MALWRLFKMDSWNPFNKRFWQWGNLFGYSDRERVEQHKVTILDQLQQQLQHHHPLDHIALLQCKLSGNPLTEPIISSTGHLYNISSIRNHILSLNHTNQTHPTHPHQLYPFETLKEKIAEIDRQKTEFDEKVADNIAAARRAQDQTITEIHPDIFICPHSKKLIEQPVISHQGIFFDSRILKTSPKPYLFTEAKTFAPMTEFISALQHYKARCQDQKKTPVVGLGIICAEAMTFFASLFYEPPPATQTELPSPATTTITLP